MKFILKIEIAIEIVIDFWNCHCHWNSYLCQNWFL